MQLHPEADAIVTKVAEHLAKQRKLSFIGGGCKYRGPDNCMCAIGALIPDELYSAAIEGHTTENLFISMNLDTADCVDAFGVGKRADVSRYLLTLVPTIPKPMARELFETVQAYHDGDRKYALDILRFEGRTDEEFAAYIKARLEQWLRNSVLGLFK
ncbi:hypothetical protein VPH49_21845 [Pseudomonas luteola]|uniref:hypothetical protein n=1 Tax=Pseudomonas luteola TaxID=47886 RepID=UPI003A8C501E